MERRQGQVLRRSSLTTEESHVETTQWAVGRRDSKESINHQLEAHEINERFRRSMEIGNVVFCAVDKIDARRLIWEAVKDRSSFFCDGRMSAEVLRILRRRQPRSLSDNAVLGRRSLRRSVHSQDNHLLCEHRRRFHAGPIRQASQESTSGSRYPTEPPDIGDHRISLTLSSHLFYRGRFFWPRFFPQVARAMSSGTVG